MRDECEKYINYYSDFIEDELSPEINELFATHLSDCSYCTGEINDMKIGMDALTSLRVTIEPEDIFLDIQKREASEKKQQIIKLVIPWVLAALFLFASIVLLFNSPANPPSKERSSVAETVTNGDESFSGQQEYKATIEEDSALKEMLEKHGLVEVDGAWVSKVEYERMQSGEYYKNGKVVSLEEISAEYLKSGKVVKEKNGSVSSSIPDAIENLKKNFIVSEKKIIDVKDTIKVDGLQNVSEDKQDVKKDLVVDQVVSAGVVESHWKVLRLKDLNLGNQDAILAKKNTADFRDMQRWLASSKKMNLQKRASLTKSMNKPKAIKTKTGNVGWSIQISNKTKGLPRGFQSPLGTPLVQGNTVYIPSGRRGKHFYSLNRETGKVNWVRKMIGFGGSNPIFYNDKVLTTTTKGLLYRFDLINDGRNKVMTLLGSNAHMISKGRKGIVFQYANVNDIGVVAAIDMNDREVVWSVSERYKPLFHIVQNDDYAYYTNSIGELVKIDVKLRKIIWRLDRLFVSNPIISDGKLYVLQMRQEEKHIGSTTFPLDVYGRALVEIDLQTGIISENPIGSVQRFDDQLPENLFSFSGRRTDYHSGSPSVQAQGLLTGHGGIVAVSTSKYVQFVNVKNKTDLWFHSYQHNANVSKNYDLPVFPCIHKDQVILFERGGDFSIKKLMTGETVQKGHLNDTFGNTRYQNILVNPSMPVVAAGWLYVASLTGKLYGIEIK